MVKTVVKARTPEHGKKIIERLKNLGYYTLYDGTNSEEANDEWYYYGVDGNSNVALLNQREVIEGGYAIVELEDLPKKMWVWDEGIEPVKLIVLHQQKFNDAFSVNRKLTFIKSFRARVEVVHELSEKEFLNGRKYLKVWYEHASETHPAEKPSIKVKVQELINKAKELGVDITIHLPSWAND